MNKNLFKYYNYLGAYNPYYYEDDNGKLHIDTNFINIIKKYPKSLKLDNIAISEIFNYKYMLADRTILEGIGKGPWMAKPNNKNNDWNHYQIRKHEELVYGERWISDKLFDLICTEIKTYIGDKKKIGILLSGGMDSRIVAGCIDYLIKTNQINSISVTAYTWGDIQSRDVIYANKIADRLNWNWKHYTVLAEDLLKNFEIAAHRGLEYSGIHLHAIPQIQRDMDVDLMLAGSFGDSIGRGEYSGVKVNKLKSIDHKFKNFGGFIRRKKFNKILNNLESDIKLYHEKFPENKEYQQYELDHQIHYMRRMLNACMEILNEKAPTYQVFTSPEVYQFIWSLDPSCRNDKIYGYLMEKFHTKLNDIPWARTGVPYLKNGNPDSFKKTHHSYSDFIQNELIDVIEQRVLSERIVKLNIFNINSIKSIIKLVKNNQNDNFDYLERLTWLVSLDFFLEEIENIAPEIGKSELGDYFTAYISEPVKYLLIRKLRWLKRKI